MINMVFPSVSSGSFKDKEAKGLRHNEQMKASSKPHLLAELFAVRGLQGG